MKPNLVLVGNGMAGMHTVEELLSVAPDKYNITVFGEESCGNYDRVMLSPVLANEKTVDDIILNDDHWYTQNGVQFEKGNKVVQIHRARKEVTAEDGRVVPYDKLLLATGSSSIKLNIPGADKYGVLGFRDVNDVDTMIEAAEHYKRATVIGGGLLGLEAAYGLMQQGMDVSVVHITDTLMERQLDAIAAKMLQTTLEKTGIRFLMSHTTTEILGDERVTGVRFSDDSIIDTDLLIMTVGIKANIELAQDSGLYCEEGIVVDDTMQTFDPNIYAVGECISHRGKTYGLVGPSFEQAKVAANHLAEMGYSGYHGSATTSTRLKIPGINVFSAGDVHGIDDSEELLLHDVANMCYKKLILRDNRIIGICLYGDTSDRNWYLQMMKDESDVSELRNALIFGKKHITTNEHDDFVNSPLPHESLSVVTAKSQDSRRGCTNNHPNHVENGKTFLITE